jgi:uncharacterized protein (TIGR02284 family)
MAMESATPDVINELIQTCIDGQNGFEAAAKAVDDPTIKNELVGYSWQRQQFATELKTKMRAAGGDPAEHGSASGALHRGWIDLKSAFGGNSRHSILAECERGEDSSVSAYRKAMEAHLPPEYSKVVETQFQTIQKTHDRIKALRDAAKPN